MAAAVPVPAGVGGDELRQQLSAALKPEEEIDDDDDEVRAALGPREAADSREARPRGAGRRLPAQAPAAPAPPPTAAPGSPRGPGPASHCGSRQPPRPRPASHCGSRQPPRPRPASHCGSRQPAAPAPASHAVPAAPAAPAPPPTAAPGSPRGPARLPLRLPAAPRGPGPASHCGSRQPPRPRPRPPTAAPGSPRAPGSSRAMFVPRSLKVKRTDESDGSVCKKSKGISNKFSCPKDQHSPAVAPSLRSTEQGFGGCGAGEEEEEMVKERSESQRWAEPGEPACVMCGRYGEYICDQTDSDVCSLECKTRHLAVCGAGGVGEVGGPGEGREGTEGEYEYREHPFIAGLSDAQVRNLRSQLGIVAEGRPVRPIVEFEHCSFPETLTTNMRRGGYLVPTPVQMQMVPQGLTGRDILATAGTGSGKTAAFLLPLITRAIKQGGPGPVGLILTPTRELAMQIESQAKELMLGLPNMRTALLVGGLPLPPQLHRLSQSIKLVIATPGRLLEILKQEAISLTGLHTLVIDEVDTMLKLGFQEQVLELLEEPGEECQRVLVSATLPGGPGGLAGQLLRDPVRIAVGEERQPSPSLRQLVLWVEEPAKKRKLFQILNDERLYRPPVLVFVECKLGAELLASAVHTVTGLHTACLHSDRPQPERSRLLQGLLDGQYEVLVSTGVLGRGLDLLNVSLLINFDMAASVDEYVHQVGRAGRLGQGGTAITFINNSSRRHFLSLVSRLEAGGTLLPAELLNSPYLSQQRRRAQRQGEARQHQTVTTENILDLIHKHHRSKRSQR
ncbi:probable ATP-dependent RNA helicase DDX59 [Callorhinchus milii]|uniref:probable ATP-dependent RNA helicase DDX59 n=1 Tax=Callorhinchus milii TaxID=7868 RepID=UPI001C3F84FD|nr:probable ATP-dependent RNA helicase DDX59 [Callorhinchus milii]